MNILSDLKSTIGWVGLFLCSIYAWRKYFNIRRKWNETIEEDNAVVMYIGGSPLSDFKKSADFKELKEAYIPITNFIDTAEKTIDVAVMVISSFILVDSLVKALERGVKVRLIVDYNDSNNSYKKLMKLGAEIYFFIECDNKISSIFHYKYAIKDFGTPKQLLYCGSLNWTDGGFQTNYEDVTFITNKTAIGAFQRNFNETMTYLKEVNSTNSYNKHLIIALKKL